MAAESAAPAPVAPVKVTPEQLGIHTGDDGYAGQLEYDLGNLCAADPSPLDQDAYVPTGRPRTCLDVATAMTQALVAQLFALPGEAVQGGRLVSLPAPTTPLPREKPVPKPKPLTKWQRFAQERGIRKRKRSKLVYDEEAGEWRRRHGYKRANDDEDVPVIEARADDAPGEDPFTQLRKEKRERVAKQAKQQAANVKQALQTGGRAAVPATLRLAATLPEKGRGKPTKRKELRDEIHTASRLSGVSTASMGKFDKRLPGEKPGERTLPGKRRKFAGVTDAVADATLMARTADRLLRERADDVLDIGKAIGRLEAEARAGRAAAKAAAGEQPGARGGKGSGGKRRSGPAPAGKGGNSKKAERGSKGGRAGKSAGRGGKSGRGGRGGKR